MVQLLNEYVASFEKMNINYANTFKRNKLQMTENQHFDVLNGKYEIALEFSSGRMSHWIANFSIKDKQTNEIIINTIPSSWELSKWLEENELLLLTLRKYPDGNVYYELKANLNERTFEYKGNKHKLSEFKKIMNS